MKRIGVLFSILVILSALLFFWNDIADLYFQIFTKLPQIEKGLTDFFIETTEKDITLPPPLRASDESLQSFLTKAGVIEWTNNQREKYGLPKLSENQELDQSAEAKVRDMLENQYFAHDSPSDLGVADLAEQFDYQFIAIGENLALGNFENDEILVQAWMDSPGHRANILNSRYQEIGVAVLRGVFEGRLTWLAVQHFGLPLSACPQPEETLKLTIDANQGIIDALINEIESLEAEIKNMWPKRGPAYQQKVDEYNELVAQYNLLIDKTRAIIDEYNSQIRLFNECISGT